MCGKISWRVPEKEQEMNARTMATVVCIVVTVSVCMVSAVPVVDSGYGVVGGLCNCDYRWDSAIICYSIGEGVCNSLVSYCDPGTGGECGEQLLWNQLSACEKADFCANERPWTCFTGP